MSAPGVVSSYGLAFSISPARPSKAKDTDEDEYSLAHTGALHQGAEDQLRHSQTQHSRRAQPAHNQPAAVRGQAQRSLTGAGHRQHGAAHRQNVQCQF